VPGYSWKQSLRTIHIAPRKQKFTDYSLNVNVVYAKHAISIDENRKDFARVPWNPDERRKGRDDRENIYFEQVWFAGVHADVGGGYQENESRLSDITLGWMLAAASLVPNGIKHDPSLLRLYPDPEGPQHDEYKAGNWQYGLRDLPNNAATMHRSVYARFEAAQVVQYDRMAKYLPENLRSHIDFAHYYTNGAPPVPGTLKAIADNIEMKWKSTESA
jgi:hypothetical protein